MLIIRKEQMEAFEETALQNFEDEMVEHIKQFTPKHSEIIGEDNVREVVKMGMEKANTCGLTNCGPVRFYIEMMFMLGGDFDIDPQYPWAGEFLNDSEIEDQMQRADRLYDRMMDYVGKVAGPDHKYENEALRRLSQMRFEELPMAEESFESEMAMLLKRIYPQKCESVGEPAINTLIQEGISLAEEYFSFPSAGHAMVTGLMFTFGYGCLTDPQFPWIGNILHDDVDDTEKAHLLYSKMKEHIENVILG